jgi:hypothetical protein
MEAAAPWASSGLRVPFLARRREEQPDDQASALRNHAAIYAREAAAVDAGILNGAFPFGPQYFGDSALNCCITQMHARNQAKLQWSA